MCIAKHNCNSHYLCVKQIVHFLLDKSGRSSSRLYNVVCSPDVWRRVLWGIEELGWDGIDYRVLVAKVEDFFCNDFESAVQVRMLMFFAKKGDFLHMMTEVLREIASRHTFSKGKDIVRVKVTIGGRGKAKAYEMCSDALDKISVVQKESGARMIMNEVKEFEGSRYKETCRSFFRYIEDHLCAQKVQLDYFEVMDFRGSWDNLHILSKCQNWLVHEFYMANWFCYILTVDQLQCHWRYLASSTDRGGHIKMLMLSTTASRMVGGSWSIYEEILESVRKVWEISDNVKMRFEDRSKITVRGGRSNDNAEESWQEVVAALQR